MTPARRTVEESFGRLQRELAQERGAALTRIAGKLERLIESLAQIRHALEGSAGAERERLVQRYAAIRMDAERQRWYLEVQRESIGLRTHRMLDQLYPIPPPLE